MREPHHQAVVGLGRHREVGRQVVAVDHQRMIARRLERPVDAAEHAFALCLISDSLPCTGTGARTTSPPNAWPIA